MDTFLWILQWVLAALFAAVGLMKLIQPYEKLAADPRQGWVNDFSPSVVRLIGLAELAGAIGLVVPGLVNLAEVLTPLAAAGLAIEQVGAAITHQRRSETANIPVNLLLVLANGFIAFGRFFLEPLG